jgi:transposase
MEEIIRFVTLAKSGRFTVTDLCEQFGISRKTAYKHLERYAEGGLKALEPRSHRPHSFPQRTDAIVEALILAERRQHRTWGPKKLQVILETKHGFKRAPGPVDDRRDPPPPRPEREAAAPAWSIRGAQ